MHRIIMRKLQPQNCGISESHQSHIATAKWTDKERETAFEEAVRYSKSGCIGGGNCKCNCECKWGENER